MFENQGAEMASENFTEGHENAAATDHNSDTIWKFPSSRKNSEFTYSHFRIEANSEVDTHIELVPFQTQNLRSRRRRCGKLWIV